MEPMWVELVGHPGSGKSTWLAEARQCALSGVVDLSELPLARWRATMHAARLVVRSPSVGARLVSVRNRTSELARRVSYVEARRAQLVRMARARNARGEERPVGIDHGPLQAVYSLSEHLARSGTRLSSRQLVALTTRVVRDYREGLTVRVVSTPAETCLDRLIERGDEHWLTQVPRSDALAVLRHQDDVLRSVMEGLRLLAIETEQ